MEIEFGHVKDYKENGFGFLSRTFRNPQGRVWFHITKIKCKYPELAKGLDSGSYSDIKFWYEVDKVNGKKQASQLWLDSQDIPEDKREELVKYVEGIWSNTSNKIIPGWLDRITIALVGQARRDELFKNRSSILSSLKRLRKAQSLANESSSDHDSNAAISLDYIRKLQEQARIVKREAQRERQIPSTRDRFRAERGVIEAIFASSEMHGLPLELQRIVRRCPRGSRTNPLSHQPGGSDVVVAYSLGDAILYDWIKNVNWYISSFEREDPGFHLHIMSIYGRFYEDPDERGIGVFCPIWTRDKHGALKSSVKACVSRYQRQMEIGHTTLHQQAKEYWKNKYSLSEQEVESLPTLYKQYMKERGDNLLD